MLAWYSLLLCAHPSEMSEHYRLSLFLAYRLFLTYPTLYFKEIRVSKKGNFPLKLSLTSGLRDDFAVAHHLLPCVVSSGSATIMCSARSVSGFVYSEVGVTQRIISITRGNGTLVHIRTNFGFDVEGLNTEVTGLNPFQPHSHYTVVIKMFGRDVCR